MLKTETEQFLQAVDSFLTNQISKAQQIDKASRHYCSSRIQLQAVLTNTMLFLEYKIMCPNKKNPLPNAPHIF